MDWKDAGHAQAGVIGLGLMGTSISACLLAAGYRVVGIDTDARKRGSARRRVSALLGEMRKEGLLRKAVAPLIERFETTADYGELTGSGIVIEAIIENEKSKRELVRRVEAVVGPETIIGCNTSAIPVGKLQRGLRHPERVLAIHWAEPAHVTRFMEIICGESTSMEVAERVMEMARGWSKEPTLVRRDIRGFVTNRCFYALIREALFLVEHGYATVADVDRSLRNDLGYWMTLAGPFRFMDLTGIPAYAAVAKDLFPELDASRKVSPVLSRMARSGAKGVANARGFYSYTPAQARRWQELFLKFSYEIRALALKYPEDIGDRPARKARKAK